LVIHDTLIIPQKKTAVLLFGKIAAFFLGDLFLQPLETVPEIAVPVRLGIHGQNVGVACRLSERDLLASSLSGK